MSLRSTRRQVAAENGQVGRSTQTNKRRCLMTPDTPQTPREELEARLTALLLGELSADEADALQQAIAQDAELARLHDRLKQAIGLVGEAAVSPEQESAPGALKLSPERRAALHAAFKVIRPKELGKATSTFARREALAIAAMIVILCLAAAIIAPNFTRARAKAQRLTLYATRDESWTETGVPATTLARDPNGRVHRSGKPVIFDSLDGSAFVSKAEPQNPSSLTVLPSAGALSPQRPASLSSISPTPKDSTAPSLSPAKPEVHSVAGATAVADLPPTLATPSPLPSNASDTRAAGQQVASRFKSIALPTLTDDELTTRLDNAKEGRAEQTATDAKAITFTGDAFTAGSSPRGRGGLQGGLGGFGSGGGEAKPAEYAGVPLGDVGGAEGNKQKVARAPGVKPADPSDTFAFAITPGAAPSRLNTDLNLNREEWLGGLAVQQDPDRAKEVNLGQLAVTTNAVIAGFSTPLNPPAQLDNWKFADALGRAGQSANSFELGRGFVSPTLEPEIFRNLDRGDADRLSVNGAQEGTSGPRPALDPRAAETKDGVEDQKKRLADVSGEKKSGVAAGSAVYFDAEGKNIVRESQRDSGLKSDDKPNPGQRPADVRLAKRNGAEIALPEFERGEAREKLQVATGPIAISEINYNSPATGLPPQKPSDVEAAVEESLRRQVKESPATPAVKEPAPVAAAEKLVEADGKRSNRSPGEATNIELTGLTRELDNLRFLQEKVRARVLQDKVDAAIPKSGIVEIVDAAVPDAAKKPTLWERARGVLGGDVERTVRLSVQKDPPDIAGIAGGPSYNTFDPYWVQTESEKIQSKAVLGKVIENLNLNEAWAKAHGGGGKLQTEETLKLLKKKIEVRSDAKTGLIDIRVKSDSSDEAARIANTIAQVYRDSRLEPWNELSRAGLQAVESALVEQGKEIARVEQELERRKQELNRAQTDEPLPKLAAGAPIPQPEVATTDNAFSTFSLNVSDVSFKLAAASLEKGQMPDPSTVRSEEFINAFDYRDPEPKGSAPIAFAWERARYPFAHDRDLVRFSIKTAASGRQPGRPLNLVLLLDNSGSMERADRVRIRQECLRVLAGQLEPQDRVSVVAFARTARLFVDGLPGNQAGELPQRVGGLAPEGGTNLEDAMNVAYQTAQRHFLADGVNRVVLLTDGAANLGDVEPESLKKKVEAHRRQGVALDCFGIGWEGLNDELLETLSRNGDGRYGFVNTPEAAQSEFAGQLAGALKIAASDVKVQVEWNLRRVTAYRQIGYAKHQLKKEQFRDNTVDAAEIGAAEAGNALYTVQVNPRGEGPLGTMRVRFRVPGTGDYREHEWTLPYEGVAKSLEQSSPALRLAASASAFSEWLVSSPFAAEVTPDKLLTQLSNVPEVFPADPRPRKLEWMIRQAKSVAGK
jgi:Mg-chelatase subunit ChlD